MNLCQFFTPVWAAELLVERYFPDLTADHLVLEPTAGTGVFLSAIPAHVPAFGVEIDPTLAAEARRRSGREVITQNILDIDLKRMPTHVIGNPPFDAKFVRALLSRCAAWLPHNHQVGFILPAYILQTSTTVSDIQTEWGIDAELLPRNIFRNLSKPLVFAVFTRGARRLVGFALYDEAAALRSLEQRYREKLIGATGSAWRAVVLDAIFALGGEASLAQIYTEIENKRPTPNPWWREKIRQICQQDLTRVTVGVYALSKEDPA